LEQLELAADDAATAREVILAVALIPHDVPAAVDGSRLATRLGGKLLCVVLPAGVTARIH
jgi:hypothetical protein